MVGGCPKFGGEKNPLLSLVLLGSPEARCETLWGLQGCTLAAQEGNDCHADTYLGLVL